MLINKKAQIGETITWIIATIIIIGILTISIFISSALGEGKSKIKIEGKQKDLLISKSLVAFTEYNREFIKQTISDNQENELRAKFEPFLKDLQIKGDIRGWNMQPYLNNQKKFESIITRSIIGNYCGYESNFALENINLNFWAEYQC